MNFVLLLNFLANFNVSFAISHNLPIFENSIRQFWVTAARVSINNVVHITATVYNQEVLISEALIREVLQFNDNHEAPVEYSNIFICESFRRMGHPDEFKSRQIIKTFLAPHWRYIVHVMIHCISIRKGGFHSANAMVASATLGLIKGRAYNFSGLVFKQMIENLTGKVKEKFLVYPRFLQMIINHLHPNLPQEGPLLVMDHMISKTLTYMKSTSARSNRIIVNIPLFGNVTGEDEPEVSDVEPEQVIESSSSKEEEEQEQEQGGQENQGAEIEVEQEVQQEQEAEQPIVEAHFFDQEIENLEPLNFQEQAENVEVHANIEVEDSESEEIVEPSPSSSKRPADSESDYELEEPRAKKIKIGIESFTTSSESLFGSPRQPSPPPSPIHNIPSPQPSPQPTPPPVSPVHETSPFVPRVKSLNLEVKKLHDQIAKIDEVIKGLNTDLNEYKEEVKDLKLEL
ncbi:hypothetical protein L1987_57955 [Smallanthus sonchifolius]|uniref:Uncharacterized protein n=1 Tax=Smallanthus sonchifolius TaxID=185202 RepID=A0ACB9DE05_9ASTR|nr:hypothetical protein L1987_57955 [Smallanthus sonchifolius]